MNQLLELAPVRCALSPRHPTSADPAVKGGPNARGERMKVEQSIRYMLEHLTDRLNIPTLASIAHASPSSYFAMFKRQSGCAPIELLIHLRMYRACVLLDTTTLTVKDIAAALGYADAFYFSRLFKSIHARAPTEYRSLPPHIREMVRTAALPEACSGMLTSLPGLNLGSCGIRQAPAFHSMHS